MSADFVPRVWAPRASSVELVLDDDERLELDPEPGGWFGASADRWLLAGTHYRFSLDGGPPLADPRAGYQPDGPDGPSVVVDHPGFGWELTEAAWRAPATLADAVLYEFHVGTFTPEGTFSAAAEKLDHLVALGVTHVELMPVATFAGAHGWGYDGVDLFAPHPSYGAPDDLRRLVQACHGRGLAVILDVVYNHLGPVGNVLGSYAPYLTDRYRTPWGEAVNLDGPGSDEVRRFFVDNALQWLRDYRFDGLRLDAVHALLDTNAYSFLEELADAVRALSTETGRSVVLVAESDRNDPRLVHAPARGGIGLDAQWCDDVHHVLHAALTGEHQGYYADYDGSMAAVADALGHGYLYRGQHSTARDMAVGRPPVGLRGRQLVAALQNHDQIGNRAGGERLHHLVGVEQVRAAAALLLLAPTVPLLFQGEEWAATSPFPYFADHDDPDLVAAVRRGRREEFAALGWDPDDVLDPESDATFERARLDWSEVDEPLHAESLGFYADVIALRHELAAELGDDLVLTGADASAPRFDVDEDARTITMHRTGLRVVADLGTGAVRIDR